MMMTHQVTWVRFQLDFLDNTHLGAMRLGPDEFFSFRNWALREFPSLQDAEISDYGSLVFLIDGEDWPAFEQRFLEGLKQNCDRVVRELIQYGEIL